ncbi:hypothetical protein Tco_0602998 [Tanacetum coccineum]
MNIRARKEEKAPCSKDSEVEDGVHPRTLIVVKKAQGIRKITLKAKIVKVGTRSLNYEEKSPVLKMMISPNLGHVKTYNGSEDPEDHLKIFQAAAKMERQLQRSKRSIPEKLPPTEKVHLRQTKRQRVHRRLHTKVHSSNENPEGDLEKGKFKTPPPMTTPVEKQNANKFCEFHGEVGHNTDECNHLRKQIEDILKAGKLSYIIRELKQSSGKEQLKRKVKPSEKRNLRQF